MRRWLCCAFFVVGCGSESHEGDGSTELDELDRGVMLLQLGPSDQVELCEAAQTEADAVFRSESARQGACLPQATSRAEVLTAIYTDNPTSEQLDDAVSACEAELERCLADGPTLSPCDFFPEVCGAFVADYRECIEGVLTIPEQIAPLSCDEYVRDASVRGQVAQIVDEALAPCNDQLAFCNDPSKWAAYAVDTVLYDAPDDDASNDEWVDRLAAVVDGHGRGCEDALIRGQAQDETAALIAAAPFGMSPTLDVETTTEWKSVVAPRLEIVLPRIQSFLTEKRQECAWTHYGLAVHGEAGTSRHVVLILTE